MHQLSTRAVRFALGWAVSTMVLAAGPACGGCPAGAAAGPARRALPARTTCSGAIQHPLQVRVTALDDVRRGQVVRLKLTLTSATAIERGEVRVVSSGIAAVRGARRAAVRAVPAGRSSEHEFALQVPASGERTLVQFVVEAEGSRGTVTRGATYQLLPDGPAERPRITRTGTGEAVAEVEARRLVP
jgi:hypothetical protein